jgi:hypothetical protein
MLIATTYAWCLIPQVIPSRICIFGFLQMEEKKMAHILHYVHQIKQMLDG